MIESFFFTPGSHSKLKEKLATIKADSLIIDLEDAVLKTNIFSILETLKEIDNIQNIWIRLVLFEDNKEKFATFKELLNQGFRNFIIPKIRNLNQLKSIESFIGNSILNEVKTIILVENPECLLNLNDLIVNASVKIEGVGFGSQDYCSETGMKHTLDYLKIPRFQIMNTAKAHKVKSIDIACMDSKAGQIFSNELKEAFEMGYDGKFLIHPAQLERLKGTRFYTKEEVSEAASILDKYKRLQKPAVFVYNDRVIEPPHIKYFHNIINWSKKYEAK